MFNSIKIFLGYKQGYNTKSFPRDLLIKSNNKTGDNFFIEFFSTERVFLKDNFFYMIDIVQSIRISEDEFFKNLINYVNKRLDCTNIICQIFIKIKMNFCDQNVLDMIKKELKKGKISTCKNNCFRADVYNSITLNNLVFLTNYENQTTILDKNIYSADIILYLKKNFIKNPNTMVYFHIQILEKLNLNDNLYIVNHVIDFDILEYHVRVFYLSYLAFYMAFKLNKTRLAAFYSLKAALTIRDGLNFEYKEFLENQCFNFYENIISTKNWNIQFRKILEILKKYDNENFGNLPEKKNEIKELQVLDIDFNINFFVTENIVNEMNNKEGVYIPTDETTFYFSENIGLEVITNKKCVLQHIVGLDICNDTLTKIYIFAEIDIGVNKIFIKPSVCISTIYACISIDSKIFKIEITQFKLVKILPKNLLTLTEKRDKIDINYEKTIFFKFIVSFIDYDLKANLPHNEIKNKIKLKIIENNDDFELVETDDCIVLQKACNTNLDGSLMISYELAESVKKYIILPYKAFV